MMGKGLTIKLDANAIEALLGAGTEEAKVELQQCVVEEYAKRHIKTFTNNTVLSQAMGNLKKEIEAYVKDYLKKPENAPYSETSLKDANRIVLHNFIRDSIKQMAEEDADKLMKAYDSHFKKVVSDSMTEFLEKKLPPAVRECASQPVIKGLIVAEAEKLITERLRA